MVGFSVEGVHGIIDCQVNHADFWDQNQDHIIRFPELAQVEYYEIPRGRVLFLKSANRPIVYLDKQLICNENKLLIATFFEFGLIHALFKTDLHYTTSANELAHLFED
jgi:hypothetical protein